jgi:hypothetical protein
MMWNGYWLAHRLQIIRQGHLRDIYQLSEQVAHDAVLIGQILVHFRDPLEVLR